MQPTDRAMALTHWIDRDGAYIVLGQREPHRDTLTAHEIMMIDGLGCVKIAEMSHRIVIVTRLTNLSIAAEETLAGHIRATADLEAELVIQETHAADPFVTADRNAALDHIQSRGRSAETVVASALISKKVDVHRILSNKAALAERSLRPVLEAWLDNNADYRRGNTLSNSPIWNATYEAGLLGRLGVIERHGQDGLYQRFVGQDLDFLDAEAKRALTGGRITDQPDKRFAEWAEAELSRSLDAGEPELHVCSGIIVDRANRPKRRDWYRLTLPLMRPRFQVRPNALVGITIPLPLNDNATGPYERLDRSGGAY